MSNKPNLQKRGAGNKLPSIPGTRPSLYNFQILTSSGITDLDNILGGGFPLGSLILVIDHGDKKQELHSKYGKVLLKRFLGEGVVHEHGLFFGSCEPYTKSFLSNLPDIVKESDEIKPQSRSKSLKEDKLEIAWRYRNLNASDSNSESSTKDYHLNLETNVNEETLNKCTQFTWQPKMDDLTQSNEYRNLFESIYNFMQKPEFVVSPGNDTTLNVARIGLYNLASSVWSSDQSKIALSRFLLALKSLLRQNLGLCMITINACDIEHLAANGKMLNDCFDMIFSLSSLSERMLSTSAFKHYNGFFEISKFTGINCLQSLKIDSFSGKYLFKSLRTKFTVEQIHLPPDLEDDPDEPPIAIKDKRNIDF